MIRSNVAHIVLALLLFQGSDALTITGFVRSTSSYSRSFERVSADVLRPARQSVILAAEPRKDEINIDAVKKEADDALKAAEAALTKGSEKPASTQAAPAPPSPKSSESLPPKVPPSAPRPPETVAKLDPKVVAATKAFQKAAAEFQVEAVAAAVGAAALGGTFGLALIVQYPSVTASVDPSVPPLAGATLLAGSALAVGLQDSQPGRIVRNILGKPTKAIGSSIAKSIKNSIDRTVNRVVSFPGYVAEQTKRKVETTVQEIESDIKAFPKKVSDAAIDAAEDFKEEIIATPGRIVEGTKESVRKTVEGTKQAVQQKTKETQEKITKTVEDVVSIPTKTVESIASLLEGEKRDPELPKPPRLPPPEEAIRQGSNQVQFPRLVTPKFQLSTPPPQAPPKVQPPPPKAARLPKFDVAKIEIPKVEVPRIEIPKVEVPLVDLPKIDIPKIKISEEVTPVPKKQEPAKKKKATNEGAQVTASVKALMAELSAEKKTPASSITKSDDSVAERRRAEEERRKQQEAQQAEKVRLALEQKQKQEQSNVQKAAERAKSAELQRQQQEERKRQQEAQQAEKVRLALEQKQKKEQANAQKAAERAQALELKRQQQEERTGQQEAKKAEAEAKRVAQQARQEEQNRKIEQQRAEQAEKRKAAAEAARLEAERRQQEQARRREEQLNASQKPKAAVSAPRASFLLGTPSQRTSSAAPRGVPTIAYWRKRADNGISGKIYGSPNFKDGERVETSAIEFGQIENGNVVKTSSGSRYFLSSVPPASDKAEKALESARPGATINLSNIFNGSANDAQSQKARPRPNQGSPQPSTTFSLFGSSRSATIAPDRKEFSSKSISVNADSSPRATFSLFGLGGGQAEPKSTLTERKVNGSKPSAPRGVPTLKNWRKNGDKSVTGNISGSPNFKTNEKVTTSPIVKGNIASGEVVTTGSGSRYFLN